MKKKLFISLLIVTVFVFLFAIGAIFGTLLPVFVTISLGTLLTGAAIPQNEEKTRKSFKWGFE